MHLRQEDYDAPDRAAEGNVFVTSPFSPRSFLVDADTASAIHQHLRFEDRISIITNCLPVTQVRLSRSDFGNLTAENRSSKSATTLCVR